MSSEREPPFRPLSVVFSTATTSHADHHISISDVLTRGASIQVEGAILPSPGPGQPVELRAASLQLLGACDEVSVMSWKI